MTALFLCLKGAVYDAQRCPSAHQRDKPARSPVRSIKQKCIVPSTSGYVVGIIGEKATNKAEAGHVTRCTPGE